MTEGLSWTKLNSVIRANVYTLLRTQDSLNPDTT